MAQPSFDSILNAVMMAESGGRRYDEKGNLLTSPKGAKGELQVLDKTKFSPGFGVEPAKANTPDERARVGRDYLKAMLDRYGDVDKALAAYNWGPGNTDKWIARGADPAKLPDETKKYISRIKTSLTSEPRATAQAPAQALPEAAVPPAPAAGAPRAAPVRVSEARPADLGPSYQAALALSFLSDEGDKEERDREYDERQPSISSQWLARETARMRPEMLAMSYGSPFAEPEPEPVKAADGGFIAVGYNRGGEARIERIKRTTPGLANLQNWSRAVAEDMYPREEDAPKRDAARHMLASAIMANKTTPGVAEFLGKAYEFKEAPIKTMGHMLGVSKPRVDYETDTFNNALGTRFAGVARDPLELQRAVRASIEKGEANLTPDEVKALGYAEGGEAKSDEPTPEELERASKAAFGIVPSSGKGRKQGRVSEALQSGEAQKELAKGLTMLPQNVVGAPVDLATLAMRPFGYRVEKPVMGSEWLKEKSRAAGVAFQEPTDPTLRAFFQAGDISSNLVNPAGATRTAVRGVEKTGEAAKMLAQMAAQDPVVARTVERAIERVAPAAAPMYAVKPRGGTFATSGSLEKEHISELDSLLDEYYTQLLRKLPEEVDHDLIKEFVDKKIRNYFTKTHGTGTDPVRLAIREGKLPLPEADAEKLPPYLVAAATNPDIPGHKKAQEHLEKFYDQMVNIKPFVFQQSKPASILGEIKSRQQFEQGLRDVMSQEALPQNFQNVASINMASPQDIQAYPSLYNTPRAMLEAMRQGELPSEQVFVLEKGKPFFDVSTPSLEALRPARVAEDLAALPPERLKNLSFDQALVEGAKLMEPRRNYAAAVDKAAKGAALPKDVLLTFTKPVTEVNNHQWVQLTDTLATQMEGKLMHHSVGGYHTSDSYGHGGIEGFKSGRAQIFSLRDKKTALPEVTIAAEKTGKGVDVSEIRGNFNSFPGHRANEIFTLIDRNPNIWKVRPQTYSRDNAGNVLPKDVDVDWQKSFDAWKALGGDGTGQWVVQNETPKTITYIWGAPTGKAAGGIVERRI